MKDCYVKCGFIMTDNHELADVYGITSSRTGETDLYYFNDPYGFIAIYGLKGVEVKPMVGDSYDVQDHIRGIILGKSRNAQGGLVYFEDKMLAVQSMYPFEVELQPHRMMSPTEAEQIEYYVDVADLDSDADEYVAVCECCLGVIYE